MTSTNRVAILGFDAADPTLVRRGAEAGVLPHFAALIERSYRGEIENQAGLQAGSVWASFARGVSVGDHGQYDGLRRFNPETYEIDGFADDGRFGSEPFWRRLSSTGKRVGIIEAPYAHLTEDLNGVEISNWGTHDPVEPGGLSATTWPPELAGELLDTFGREPLRGKECDLIAPRTRRQITTFRDQMVQRARTRGDMIEWLFPREPWDFFLATYSEAHCVGHQCWKVHDPERPDHDPRLARRIGDPVEDVYRALDDELGRFLAMIGDDVTTVVYLSHGMEPSVSGTVLLDKILVRLDGGDIADRSHGPIGLLRTTWKRLPPQFRIALAPVMHRIWPQGVGSAMQGNRDRRRFFEVNANNTTGGVRINLKGREARGLVEPGEEYDRLLDQLRLDLMEIINLDTGEPLAERVVETRELYPDGAYLDTLPDLLVDWNKRAGSGDIVRVRSPKIGTIDNGTPGPRSGDHGKTSGMFLAFGPGIEPGQHSEIVSVIDLAPTVLTLLDTPIDGLDGTPIGPICGR